MTTFALNKTHLYIEKLQEAGHTPEQAKAIVEVINEIDLGPLATKSDLKDLTIQLMISQLAVGGVVLTGVGVLLNIFR